MRFYRIRDDLEIRRRWRLGDVRMGAQLGLAFDSGAKFSPEGPPLSVGIAAPGGLPLDFTLTTLGVPILFNGVAHRIAAVAPLDVQLLPVWVDGLRTSSGRTDFAVLNALRVVSCLDERRSEYLPWRENDHRRDLVGEYRQVTRLVLNRSRIPDDAHVFRVEGWRIALIVSELVKRAIERFGCRGARFEEVA